MKLTALATATFLAIAGLHTAATVKAAPPPAETFQAGDWQPVARIDRNRPMTIRLVNNTDLALEYALTRNEAPSKRVLPGDRATLRSVPHPANVLINAVAPEVTLKYDIAVNNNIVTVNIRQLDNSPVGDLAVNIHETGAIYVY
ncbi:MAG: hypothetical protein F6K19_24690 [Cyanothece sp. SIO1E1]|nr:hypothetical protein [Cyanothece sp. SIO1E1]